MIEFLEEILVENADMSLHGKVQEYLQSIMEVDFRTSGSEENCLFERLSQCLDSPEKSGFR